MDSPVPVWRQSGVDFEGAKISVILIGVFSGPPAPVGRRSPLSDLGLVAAIAAVALYALLVGILILMGRVEPGRAYWLFALPCLVPAGWYGFGFLRADGRDIGLVLSSAGWFFAALTFFFKHLSSVAALSSGRMNDASTDSPLSYICAFLAVAGVVGGAVLSAQRAMNGGSG